MKKMNFVVCCGIFTIAAGTAVGGGPITSVNPIGRGVRMIGDELQHPADVLYVNGPWDGVNGYSNILGGGFDLDRSLLDDFTVPSWGGWDIDSASTLYIWNSGGVGLGTDMTIEFYANTGNCTPDTVPVAVAMNRVYTEVDAGMGTAFGREIVLVSVSFDTIHLDPGHYWVELQLSGNDDHGFILTASQKDCECWVDYADFGGRNPGVNIFGVSSDIVFSVSGVGFTNCLGMMVSDLVAGEFATWDIDGATPGARVVVVNGFEKGETVIVDESGFCVTFGIADVDRDRVIGVAVADESGHASIVRHVLKNLSGLTVFTQAAQDGTCGGEDCVSNIDRQVIG